MLKIFFALLVLVTLASCHPTRYPNTAYVNCSAPPEILSFHIHIVYMLTDDGQIERADALRSTARDYFSDLLGPDCDGRYDNGVLCLIYDHDINDTLHGGPFPSGEWSMFVPVSYYAQTIPWFTQNHGEFSLLVHPNTGCEYEDHSDWALWAGDKWPLDLGIFIKETQTNEFDASRGDSGNPVCLPSNAVCGNLQADGPDGVCCLGLECQCPTDECVCLKSNQNILTIN